MGINVKLIKTKIKKKIKYSLGNPMGINDLNKIIKKKKNELFREKMSA